MKIGNASCHKAALDRGKTVEATEMHKAAAYLVDNQQPYDESVANMEVPRGLGANLEKSEAEQDQH